MMRTPDVVRGRWTFDLECIDRESQRIAESSGWIHASGKQSWHLPTGSYFLRLLQDGTKLGDSPSCTVSSGATTPFIWQLPALK